MKNSIATFFVTVFLGININFVHTDAVKPQFSNTQSIQTVAVSDAPTNYQLLVLSQMVYSNIDVIGSHTEETLADILYSHKIDYVNATYNFISNIAKNGFKLSDVVQKAKLSDWSIYSVKYDEKDAFFGVIFKNKITGKFVVSFRGTNSLQDVYEDLAIATSDKENPQVVSARELLDKLPKGLKNSDIVLTGHSLGGYLAARLGAEEDYKTITFNAFGFKSDYLSSLRQKGNMKYESDVINYHIEGDLISDSGEHVGKVIKLPNIGDWNFPQTHRLNSFYSFVN